MGSCPEDMELMSLSGWPYKDRFRRRMAGGRATGRGWGGKGVGPPTAGLGMELAGVPGQAYPAGGAGCVPPPGPWNQGQHCQSLCLPAVILAPAPTCLAQPGEPTPGHRPLPVVIPLPLPGQQVCGATKAAGWENQALVCVCVNVWAGAFGSLGGVASPQDRAELGAGVSKQGVG